MKTISKRGLDLFFVCITVVCASPTFADMIVLPSDQELTGEIIQTNQDDVLILTRFEAFNYSRTRIKQISAEPTETAELSSTNRMSDFETAILLLSKQSWATNLSPIPATVIDKGMLKNVPYSSFHCGVDYEVNIYGDLQNPAGIEIGIYHKLLNDDSAKSNCLNFIQTILNQQDDKAVLRTLNKTKDLKIHDDITFEITPPTGDDAYGGWWVSVYSEKRLNLARASEADMQQITMTQSDMKKDVEHATNYGSWSADDLRIARHLQPTTFTFADSSGTVISNATVANINDGVSLIWEKDNGKTVGFLKLEDLPPDLRTKFGYNEAKSKAADKLAAENKVEWNKEVQAAQQEAAATLARANTAAQNNYSPSYYDSSYSTGDAGAGMVYVHGYYRSNGTYVHPYYRSYPSR